MPKHSAPWSRFRRAAPGDVRQGLVPRAALEGALATGACRPFGSHALQRVAQAAGILHHLVGRIALSTQRAARRTGASAVVARLGVSFHGQPVSVDDMAQRRAVGLGRPTHLAPCMAHFVFHPHHLARQHSASPNPCRTPPAIRRAPPGSDGDGTGDGDGRPACLPSPTGKKRYVHNAAFARKACVWRMRAFPAALHARRRFCRLARAAPKRDRSKREGRGLLPPCTHAAGKRSKPSLLRRFAAYRGEDAETRYNLVQTEDDKQGRRRGAGARRAEARPTRGRRPPRRIGARRRGLLSTRNPMQITPAK